MVSLPFILYNQTVTDDFQEMCSKEWLAMLTVVPLGLGSNPGEYMDVCKCIVPSRHWGTLNSRRATNPLVRLVEER
ncbi:hypothetical protein TNCV_3613981 [Trichonephila clavipes]|uniref:Uncharacterized protein n=1 Tax=Trichonephila clavipes TaxID=2585209 RepID=A0A8X6VIN5_TRICX|nr:hypothetical protein TNCV_3613981 [Trichonephila clavipes]